MYNTFNIIINKLQIELDIHVGVAPRAKMNQQRARRFRTAAEAAKKAESRGEESSQEAPFDSNCITPGLTFIISTVKIFFSFLVHSMKPLLYNTR